MITKGREIDTTAYDNSKEYHTHKCLPYTSSTLPSEENSFFEMYTYAVRLHMVTI